MDALSVILVAWTAFWCAMIERSLRVHRFRMRLLREEGAFLRNALESGRMPYYSGHKRFEALPSYDDMMLKFWIRPEHWERPLSEFYAGIATEADELRIVA